MISHKKKTVVVIATVAALIAGIPFLVFAYYNAHSPGKSQGEAGLKIVVERIDNGTATSQFKFKNVPTPAQPNAVTTAHLSLPSGRRDPNSGPLALFQYGILPDGPDAPGRNFFFSDGSIGGRIMVDLNQPMDINQVNTYSWHASDRGPQRYDLYAHADPFDGTSPSVVGGDDPVKFGWVLLAKVDTRPKSGSPGGQYGVSISSPKGTVGHYRYLLFDCRRNESTDRWGNTFYSGIDVIAK